MICGLLDKPLFDELTIKPTGEILYTCHNELSGVYLNGDIYETICGSV